VITHTIPWLVHFSCLPLQSLTSKIVTILILERAYLFYSSLCRPALKDALDRAYSEYGGSETHSAVTKQFPAPPKAYHISQYTEFILDHRLRWPLFACFYLPLPCSIDRFWIRYRIWFVVYTLACISINHLFLLTSCIVNKTLMGVDVSPYTSLTVWHVSITFFFLSNRVGELRWEFAVCGEVEAQKHKARRKALTVVRYVRSGTGTQKPVAAATEVRPVKARIRGQVSATQTWQPCFPHTASHEVLIVVSII
jgi:hypothetical protein